MTLEELFFNTSDFRVYVGPYSYGELDYCDRLHILITFIYIISPLLTSTHKPVLARAPSSISETKRRRAIIVDSNICFLGRRFQKKVLPTTSCHCIRHFGGHLSKIADISKK